MNNPVCHSIALEKGSGWALVNQRGSAALENQIDACLCVFYQSENGFEMVSKMRMVVVVMAVMVATMVMVHGGFDSSPMAFCRGCDAVYVGCDGDGDSDDDDDADDGDLFEWPQIPLIKSKENNTMSESLSLSLF